MFNNIGKKIKTLAVVIFILEVLAAFIVGLCLLEDDDYELFALLLILLGPFVAWVSSFFVYGLGQLIDNTDIIVSALNPQRAVAPEQENSDFITQDLTEITKNQPVSKTVESPSCTSWKCKCGKVLSAEEPVCSCGNSIDNNLFWSCVCGKSWSGGNTICSCGRSVFDNIPTKEPEAFCTNCGKILGKNTTNFCTYCGHKLL